MLDVGQAAPAFALHDQDGTPRSLDGVRGKWLVLYFYPKDDTPGCTVEACAFRDDLPRFESLDAVVWGVSADDEKAHQKFATHWLHGALASSVKIWKTGLVMVPGPVKRSRTGDHCGTS